MPFAPEEDFQEWIWIPVGFAHGNYFTHCSSIEYFCTAQWNPACETGISPIANDLLWDLAEPKLLAEFKSLVKAGATMSAKDRGGLNLAAWLSDPRRAAFEGDFQ
jgi:dTDP-4-dehydrorhamnose 3,5-epimerase-like enzyme